MKRPIGLILLLLLLAPSCSAEEPADAPAIWREMVGDDGVMAVDLGAPVRAGEPIVGHIQFRPDYPIAEVQYQICQVGESCFAIGVPTEPDGGGGWHFTTAVLRDVVGRPVPTTFAAGERIGIQFFVFLEGMAEGEFLHFPEGLPDDHPWAGRNATHEEYLAWSETHYFAVTIQEGEQVTPGPAAIILVPGLAALAWLRRTRAEV